MTRIDAAPIRRELALGLVAQRAVETLANAADLEMALRMDPHPSLEADRQAIVHQQQDIAVGAGVLVQMREQIEEALATGDVAVERRDHALARPNAVGAPWRVEDDVVDRGADRVMRGADTLRRHAAGERGLVEQLDRLDDLDAQGVEVRLGADDPQPPREIEQRKPCRDERRHALAAEQPAVPGVGRRRRPPPRSATAAPIEGAAAFAGRRRTLAGVTRAETQDRCLRGTGTAWADDRRFGVELAGH